MGLPKTTLALACLCCAACIPAPPERPDNAFVVGALLPFSGDLASSGINLERPLLMVSETVNLLGGVHGQPLAIVSEDSHMSSGPNFDIELGVTGYRKLAAQQARALVGPKSTDLAKRLSGITSTNNVVYFPGSIGSRRTLAGACAFDFLPNVSVLAKALAKQMADDGMKNIALVYVSDEYGDKFASQVQTAFEAKGGKVVLFEYVDRGQTQFTAVVDHLRVNSPDAVVLLTYPLAGAGIIQEVLTAKATQAKWYLAPTLREPEFLALIPPGALNGAKGVAPGVEAGGEAFVEAFQARWKGDAPRLEASYYYDMAAVLSLATMQATQSTGTAPSYQSICQSVVKVSNGSGETVRWNELERAAQLIAAGQPVDYHGLSGPIAFDNFGNLTQGSVEIWSIENNAMKTETTFALDSL